MGNDELINSICAMVKFIHSKKSLKRIYNVVSYLLRHDE